MSTARPYAPEKAAAGASSLPLSKEQKRVLCQWAAQAWRLAGMPYFADQDDLPAALRLTKTQALEVWRHEEQLTACGKRHLTACTQRDYLALRGHWMALLGRYSAAARDVIEHSTGERQVALRKLGHEIEAAKDVIENGAAYVAAIARARYRSKPEDLSAKKIWVLIFDLRRNAGRRRKKR